MVLMHARTPISINFAAQIAQGDRVKLVFRIKAPACQARSAE